MVDGGVCFVSQRSPVTANQRRKVGVCAFSSRLLLVVSRQLGDVSDVGAYLVVFLLDPLACFMFLVSRAYQCNGSWRSVWNIDFQDESQVLDIKGKLQAVFQRIDVFSKDFDNIAEVEIGAPWPLPPLEATATLAHKFELLGTCKIKITSEKTTAKTSGNLAQIPPFDIPRLSDNL
ncbi:hypothetical protein Bca52824_001688 [Brassica carinata]|uniref:Plastid lipid-associated protein/fibrillin conserved domain-containing protein n=1 Tax=Brassica carinata TaxID=52824 RepID=A0A8X7WM09_BRACI|nr:hypothetical protein Bca52824_001688 [Brassica carinata]